MNSWRMMAVTVLLALAAAFLGAWGGAHYLAPSRPSERSLHDMLHTQLELSDDQDARLHAIEADFAVARQRLERELTMANTELANAIRTERRNGPQVAAAIHHFHEAMGRLQYATIEHVFAMRSVLTPAQAEQFDRTVADALTKEAH